MSYIGKDGQTYTSKAVAAQYGQVRTSSTSSTTTRSTTPTTTSTPITWSAGASATQEGINNAANNGIINNVQTSGGRAVTGSTQNGTNVSGQQIVADPNYAANVLAEAAAFNAPTPVTDPIPVAPFDLTTKTTDVPATVLADARTSGDVERLLQQQDELFKQKMEALNPSQEYLNLQKLYNDKQNELRKLDEQGLQGQTAIESQAIPMPLIGQQRQEMANQIAFKRIPISNEMQAITGQLSFLQDEKKITLEKLNLMAQQGQVDLNLAMKYNDEARKEAKEAKSLIMERGNTEPYVNINGTVYQSSNGYGFTSEKDFMQKTGMTLQQAEAKGMVGKLKGTDDMLSVAEAKSLGVPYGTTKNQAAQMGITPSSSDGSSPTSKFKAPTATIVTKYHLPSTVSADDFNTVNDALQEGINQATGGRGVGSLTQEQKYQLWDQAAKELIAAGFEPKDFDALLWELFAQDGLKAYNSIVLGQTSSTKSSERTID